MPGPLPRLHLPFAEWPAADQELWVGALNVDNDPFSDAAGARYAKSSLRQYWFCWRRFLGFLTLEDPAALELAPFERLTMARVREFVSHLRVGYTPHSVAIQVQALYQAARLMMPERDWGWLKVVKARLYAAAPARAAHGPIITSLQLLDLGQAIMDQHKPVEGTPLRLSDAVSYRDGLMIALLAFIPIRRKNVAAIEIDRHLIREGNTWFLIVPESETKTGALIEFPVADLLNPYLAAYLEVVRPRLLRRSSCKALWINRWGYALSYSAIWPILTRHTASRLGIRISPHDVRDAAATMWAIAAPDQIGVARDLLTQRDLRTTTRHYNRARGIQASQSYALVLAARRRKRRGSNRTIAPGGQ